MNCTDADNLVLQIDNAFDFIDRLNTTNLDLQGYLAKYMTVFICGIYEEAIESILNEMADKVGSMELKNYVSSTLDRTFRNPDKGNVCGMLKRFNPSWAAQISGMNNDMLDALDSIVNNKNSIAHGEPCSITIQDIKDYYNKSIEVIKRIDTLVLSP